MITVNWNTKLVYVPQSFLTLVSGSLYELDLDAFRLALKAIEAGEGISYEDIHRHTAGVTISGATAPLTVEIINGYTVEFENGAYRINIVGGNSNISDVTVLNTVQVASFNSFGLVQSPGADAQAVWGHTIESGLSAEELIRIFAAVLQGSAQGLEGASPQFYSVDGGKVRLTASYSGGNRTVTGRDPTP